MLTPHTQKETHTELTTAEIRVLALVRAGLSNKEIASTLFISERTVKFHVSNLLLKKAMESRAQLIAQPCPAGCPFRQMQGS